MIEGQSRVTIDTRSQMPSVQMIQILFPLVVEINLYINLRKDQNSLRKSDLLVVIYKVINFLFFLCFVFFITLAENER